jgi:HAD superfamily hydrolase (TIGR01509 family)
MPHAAIFDVDGTLVDSNDLHAEAWGETFRRYGVDLPHAVIRGQVGKGGDNLIPALLPPRLVAKHGEEMREQSGRLFRDRYLARVIPFPGVRDLFEALKGEGIAIVLASSSAEEEVTHHCDRLGVSGLVDHIVSGDQVDHSKPCPDIFAAALRKLKVAAAEAVVIGDSPYDMEAADQLGIPAVALLCGGFDPGLLRWSGAAALFDGPWTLPHRIGDWLPADARNACPTPLSMA